MLEFSFPLKRITVNLSPVDIQKEGTHYDLAISLTLLSAMSIIDNDKIALFIYMYGRIILKREHLPPRIFCLARSYACCKDQPWNYMPAQNRAEAIIGANNNIIAPEHIIQIIDYFIKTNHTSSPSIKRSLDKEAKFFMGDIKG